MERRRKDRRAHKVVVKQKILGFRHGKRLIYAKLALELVVLSFSEPKWPDRRKLRAFKGDTVSNSRLH